MQIQKQKLALSDKKGSNSTKYSAILQIWCPTDFHMLPNLSSYL